MALDFFAGCIGGCAGVVVGHPLDTVKIHLQTQDGNNPKYRGTFHCMQSLLTKEGVRGLYRGMSSPLAGVAAINAVVFGVYGNTQRNLSEPDSLTSHFMAGGAAGFLQSFLCSPMELAKSRSQVAKITPMECLRRVYRTEGTRAVFRGLGSTVAREVPSFAIYFCTFEYMTRNDDYQPVSTGQMLMAGGVAGIASWVFVYPVDVIKSRLQIDGVDSKAKYKNSFDCLAKSVKAEGSKILFRGLTPTVLRAFPVNAATFTVVTWTIRLCSNEENVIERRMKETESLWERCLVSKLRETVPSCFMDYYVC